ncbi:hypothetical protein ACOMHN_030969 [Nucella lapillus]
MPSIDALLTQSQLRWSGHLVRMQDSMIPKQLFYGELTGGHLPRGRPKLRYKDTLKKSLQKCDIDEDNGNSWPQTGLSGGKQFAREQKLMNMKDKSAKWKNVQQQRSGSTVQNVPLSVPYAAACVHRTLA